MDIKAINNLNTKTISKSNNSQKQISVPNFEGMHNSLGKKALKGVSVATLLGMLATSCAQPTNPTPEPTIIEQTNPSQGSGQEVTTTTVEPAEPNQPTTPTEPTKPSSVPATPLNPATPITEPSTPITPDKPVDEPNPVEEPQNIIRTERSPIFEAAKEMIEYLNLDTKTQKVQLKENSYTPYSGDILHVEFDIGGLGNQEELELITQAFDLNVEKSTPQKLVYTNSQYYKSNPDIKISFESSFEQANDGSIIRRDSKTPQYFYRYSLNDNGIQVAAYNTSDEKLNYRETYYLVAENSGKSEYLNTYKDSAGMRKNACITYAQ